MITVDGKIGVQRALRLLDSTPLLSAWLNTHPRKSDPEAPCSQVFSIIIRFMTYAFLAKIVRHIAQLAGIRKRVYPYLFRHSRLTELARTGFSLVSDISKAFPADPNTNREVALGRRLSQN